MGFFGRLAAGSQSKTRAGVAREAAKKRKRADLKVAIGSQKAAVKADNVHERRRKARLSVAKKATKVARSRAASSGPYSALGGSTKPLAAKNPRGKPSVAKKVGAARINRQHRRKAKKAT